MRRNDGDGNDNELMEMGKQMGLDGKELLDQCAKQQKIKHEERAARREVQKAKREAEE